MEVNVAKGIKTNRNYSFIEVESLTRVSLGLPDDEGAKKAFGTDIASAENLNKVFMTVLIRKESQYHRTP